MPALIGDSGDDFRRLAEASRYEAPSAILAQLKASRTTTKEEVEDIFREEFLDLLAYIDLYSEDASQVWNLLDVVFLLSRENIAETNLPYSFIEDLLDSQTIAGCAKVLDYLEVRKSDLKPSQGADMPLILLRALNELLRRLSRAENTVLCGRIFILMFQCIPLGHRSSINLRGVFHTENVTIYDQITSEDSQNDMDVDQDTQQDKKLDPQLASLYPKFWSMQTFFSSPTDLFDHTKMIQFKDSIIATLKTFQDITATEPKTSAEAHSRGTNHTSSNAFNPKYLTNPSLFSLELHDGSFRRNILVQILIIMDFLLLLSSPEKARLDSLDTEVLKKQLGGSKNLVLQYDGFQLSKPDQTWITETRKEIEKLLSSDKLYLRMVNTVLDREQNWAFWKAIGCPTILRPAVPVSEAQAAQSTLRKICEDATAPLPVPMGAKDLAFLSDPIPVEALQHSDFAPPSLQEYYESIETDNLDLDFAEGEERKGIEERKAGKLWRALRSATGRKFKLCEEIKNGDNLKALIEIDKPPEALKDEEQMEERDDADEQVNDEQPVDVTREEQVNGNSENHDAGLDTIANVKDEKDKAEEDEADVSADQAKSETKDEIMDEGEVETTQDTEFDG
ncbi:hypothetical protein BT93_L4535 [Corymbia citriodora subsp. variegata]|uniref:THO complex subunit 1 n=1 Tax=Corymbia citriodora subsp. variegata TaxID=360336 RepID=A0A8T0CKN7_CORYI|nr:hypothetical protein BT93_L4535 [Corymbia citriodora subsp. variegata]